MKEFVINANDAGQRLDRFIAKAVPLLPASLSQKYIRLKRIKINGRAAKRDARLSVGDAVQMYINDEFFEPLGEENAYLLITDPNLNIIYEDEHIILVDKKPGMPVHADENEKFNTLITNIQAYLYYKGEWAPRKESSFTPALCNRIDRNTGGIVIAAKTAEALRILNEKIRDREIEKLYLCIIHGRIDPPSGKLKGFIARDLKNKQVMVYNKPMPGAKTAETLYKTLKTDGDLSLLECELLTGRTHQIRAQLAAAGHPLLGDGKYGNEKLNKPYGMLYQALYSYRLRFSFKTGAGVLDYLRDREFTVEQVDFVRRFFG